MTAGGRGFGSVGAGGVARRTLLRAAASGAATLTGGAATLAGLGGCAQGGRGTQVVVVWSGSELAYFRAALDGYPHPVDVISAGDDIDELLRARHRAGTDPDVAIVPRLGLIKDYAARGWLTPLDRQRFAPRFPDAWNRFLTFDRQLYGAWVKATHKSLFWYRPSALDGRSTPATWEELVQLVGDLARRRPPAPLAIGAADGWVLSDWFENLLAAGTTTGQYDQLAGDRADWGSEPVRQALQYLAELWRIPGAFPDGGERALLTQNEESVIQVVRSHRAAMLFEGDFVAGVARAFQPRGGEALQWFDFPAVAAGERDATRRPLLVSGDPAVVLRDTPAAHDLVEWLTGENALAAFGPWLDNGGYLTPNGNIPPDAYRDTLSLQLAQKLRDATDLRYDLSDQLIGPLTGADGRGSWKILQDFFAEVTHRDPDVPGAVARAVDRFVKGARQPRSVQ